MFSYEDLEVYKTAYRLNGAVYRLLKNKSDVAPYIQTQLGRASLSILLNIAEGSAKFSAMDRRRFFIIARASAFECSSIISFLANEGELTHTLKLDLNTGFEEISKMLYAMIKKLEIKQKQ